MKKTKILLKMAALAVVGAMMSGCAEEVEVVQPAVNGTVTMKTTISLDGKSATRALTEGGVKTFAAGDQIAVIYEQGTGTGKAVSIALTELDNIYRCLNTGYLAECCSSLYLINRYEEVHFSQRIR